MDDEIRSYKQLKSSLELYDELTSICDAIRFNSKIVSQRDFIRLTNRIELLSSSIDKYIKQHKNCFYIYNFRNSVIIEPGEKQQIYTNVDNAFDCNYPNTEFIFRGYIPSTGNLEVDFKRTSYGIDVKIKNNIKIDAYDTNYEDHMCLEPQNRDVTITPPGIYKIKKHAIIGVGIQHKK